METTEDFVFDVNFDFATDTDEKFWDDIDISSETGRIDFVPDPDTESPTLAQYHEWIWSNQQLQGSKVMALHKQEEKHYRKGSGEPFQYYYLTWKDFEFTSDIIVTDFSRYVTKYPKCRNVIKQVINLNYQTNAKKRTKKFYSSFGSFIIFPKMRNSINQVRGTDPLYDRFDLTLECIRRFYREIDKDEKDKEDKDFPLYQIFAKEENTEFFKLFRNFEGYVKFFYLQDLVKKNYSVKFWIGNGKFEENPFPKTPKEYKRWIKKQLTFTKKRSKRIKRALLKRKIAKN